VCSGVAIRARLHVASAWCAGLICRGERRNPAKVAGILISFAAIGVLSAGSPSSAPESARKRIPVGVSAVLVLVPILTWGWSDSTSAVVGRHLHIFAVCIFSLVGNSVSAIIFGLVYLMGDGELERLSPKNAALALIANIFVSIGWCVPPVARAATRRPRPVTLMVRCVWAVPGGCL
jgi:drug/metabolite transporter (DMT)-like permease